MADAAHPAQLGPPVFENIARDPRRSFYWHSHGFPSPLARWNYHPEYELHLIRRSVGRYVVGDYAGRFGPGNLVLVGPNLPHAWFSDLPAGSRMIAERDVVAQFHPDWIESLRSLCPEVHEVAPLLDACARGVVFAGRQAAACAERLEAMGQLDALSRVLALIDILRRLARTDYRVLASRHYVLEHRGVRSERVDAILQYIHRNFDQKLCMARLAAWQDMTPSTFSRFFKRATGDTFVAFVRRLRVDQACRLLLEDRASVADICFRVGYGNLSNFNRHFRRQKGVTPREYRRAHRAPAIEPPLSDAHA